MGKRIFLCVVILTTLQIGSSQDLRSHLANSTFPTEQYRSSACYDGSDSVFVFGNAFNSENASRNIYKYSLTEDKLEIVAQLPDTYFGGHCVSDSLGNFYYVKAWLWGSSSRKTFKYSPTTQLVEEVEGHPLLDDIILEFKIAQTDADTVFLFSYPNKVLRWELSTMTFQSFPNLTQQVIYYQQMVVEYDGNNWIFLFGDRTDGNQNNVMRYNIENGETELLLQNNILDAGVYMSSFLIGNFAYIVPGTNMDTSLYQRLIKYDVKLKEMTEYLFVEDFPFPGNQFNIGIHLSASVYVEKLKRVYFFGGIETNQDSDSNEFTNKIFYIDFDEIPTTTSITTRTTPNSELDDCVRKDDGIYPHPLECGWFVICRLKS